MEHAVPGVKLITAEEKGDAVFAAAVTFVGVVAILPVKNAGDKAAVLLRKLLYAVKVQLHISETAVESGTWM